LSSDRIRNRIRDALVGTDTSIAERMRLRRWEFIRRHLPELPDMKVLDLGGSAVFWKRAPVLPQHVTIINLQAQDDTDIPWATSITGDACRADRLVTGQSFDLVFSNSLIEHVGGHNPRSALAHVVRSLAPRYLVQTPYRYFPIEPHWLFPCMQFLPVRVRGYIAPRWPLGHTRGWDAQHALSEVMYTELIGAAEMRDYFPDGRLYWERVAGIAKSMIMVR
jgi:Methyltransferase domain